jgi:surfeit locus 1 family protein
MTPRAILATVMTAIMLLVLLWLGMWQWERLHWKEALIAEIKASNESAPITLDETMPTKEWKPFQRVKATGLFDNMQEQRVWTSDEGKTGWRIITPMFFTRPGPQDHICQFPPVILVERGVAFGKLASLAEKPLGPVTVEGRLFQGDTSAYVGSAGSKPGEWTLADVEAMAKVLRPPGEQCIGTLPTPQALKSNLLRLVLHAETPTGADLPSPEPRTIQLSNRHFEYALTYWSFAGILLIIWLVFLRGEWRANREKPADKQKITV